MTEVIHRTIDEVAGAAKRIHGLYSTRASYQTALVAELQARGIPVRPNVILSECYDDMGVSHCLDLIASSQLGIEVRSAEEVLPDHYYASLLEFYLAKAGLTHGLILDFAGHELKVIRINLSAAHGITR